MSLMALAFVDLKVEHPLIIISVILLTSLVFSLAGFINALFANSFDDISIIPTFVLTPLIYLGGVFYSSALLPGFWQGVSAMNPIFYMVNTFRYGFLGVSDVPVAVAFLILISFAVVLSCACLWLLNRGTGLRT